MRNSFVRKNVNSDCEYFGSKTDGLYKLDVLIFKKEDDDINFEKGTKLSIIGDLQEYGKKRKIQNIHK